MRNLLAAAALVPVMFLVFVSTTGAQSANLQAELDALLAQLAALQAQLQVTTGTPTTPQSTAPLASCPNLSRALRQGMSGSDVTALQAFLATNPSIYPEGTVSGYFGALTQLAVQRFQSRHGIVSNGTPDTTGFGAVGPMTRAAILSICASGTNTPPAPTSGGNCIGDGILISNGSTASFYSVQYVPNGSSCDGYRETRQCVNGVLSGNTSYRYASCVVGASSIPGACTLDGAVLQNGESRTFYRQKEPVFGVQCQSVSRTCTNGILSGSSEYAQSSCVVATAPSSCTLDGVTVPHGQSRTFYKRDNVLFGQSCSAFQGTRTCDNGTMNGDSDYRYAACTAGTAKSCTVVTTVGTTTSTTTVAHGASRNFWSETSVPYTTNCDAYKLARTCNDGVLSGSSSYRHPSCSVVEEKSCDIDGITVAGSQSRTFYSARSVASTKTCASISQSRTCSNGTLSGTATYQYAYCAPTGQRYCVLDGAYVAHGASKPFYSTRTPAFGSSCSQFDESRSCSDGTLSGSAAYAYASCTEPTGASCTLDGQTVAHNQTYTFYSRSTAPSGGSCAEYAQARTCIDGVLSGSSSFDHRTCSSSTSDAGNVSQVAAALSAMEALLKAALVKLNSWF